MNRILALDLPIGETDLRTWRYRPDGKVGGASLTEVEALPLGFEG